MITLQQHISEGILSDDLGANLDDAVKFGWIQGIVNRYSSNPGSADRKLLEELKSQLRLTCTAYTGKLNISSIKAAGLRVAILVKTEVYIIDIPVSGRGKTNMLRFNDKKCLYRWGGKIDYGDNNMAYMKKLLTDNPEVLILPHGMSAEFWNASNYTRWHK